MNETKDNIFKPVLAKRNSEYVALQIEESIIQKVYLPDDKLPSERELATQFGVGRGAIREALSILSASGYVEVKHGGDGGTYIKEFDSTRISKSVNDLVRIGNISLQEITEMRVLIESAILESVINSLGPEEIREIEENIEKCEALLQNGESVYGEIQNFHTILSSFCKNRLFHHILISLTDIINTYVSTIRDPEAHLKQHKMIVASIKQKDLKKSRQLVVNHLNKTSKIIKSHIQAKPDEEIKESS